MKAIDTRYGGHLFRSRLEARWAVFFDKAKIEWEYEVEGYTLPSGNYLPDFWLRREKLFIEIKPAHQGESKPAHEDKSLHERRLLQELAEYTGYEGYVFYGTPRQVFMGSSTDHFRTYIGDTTDHIYDYNLAIRINNAVFGKNYFIPGDQELYRSAILAASEARFEFGAQG